MKITRVHFFNDTHIGRGGEMLVQIEQGQILGGTERVELSFDEDARFLRIDVWPVSEHGKQVEQKEGHMVQLVPMMNLRTVQYLESVAELQLD